MVVWVHNMEQQYNRNQPMKTTLVLAARAKQHVQTACAMPGACVEATLASAHNLKKLLISTIIVIPLIIIITIIITVLGV